MFGQQEGATPLTSGVSRVPAQSGTGVCDKAGRYWLVVERKAAKGSDAARWPMELTFHVEHPLKKGVTPAQSEPEYGAGGKDATLPTAAPKDITGGTGFNDARTLHQGVWRDKVLPAQTLWYKVPVGWGQQLRYDVEFANEPTVRGYGAPASFGGTQVYTPKAGAAVVAADTSRDDSGSSADETPGGGGGWSTGRLVAVAAGGVGVLLLAGLAVAYGRARRRPRADGGNSDPMRGGSW
ncbi:hypothetical protein Srufu_039240 [Streptomyces libani subsp. rufus]|nr:hypothetical protein Srufu_039240 [Streptomyces libani subsp. rufus]